MAPSRVARGSIRDRLHLEGRRSRDIRFSKSERTEPLREELIRLAGAEGTGERAIHEGEEDAAAFLHHEPYGL